MGWIRSTPNLVEEVLVHFTVRDVVKIRHIADQLRIAFDEVKDSRVPEKYMKFFPSSLLHVPIPNVRQDLYKSLGLKDIVDSKTNLAASALVSCVSFYTIIHRFRKILESLFVRGSREAFSLCPTDGKRRVIIGHAVMYDR